MVPNETIAAIASPPGPALRGLVRFAGPRAWAIASGPFAPDVSEDWPPRGSSMHVGALRVSGLSAPLPARLAWWPGPLSFTGGPVAEWHMIGSPPVLERALADGLAGGARLAEPGEFTLRAFLSGRIDLTGAEAVLALIEAEGPRDLQRALADLAGGTFRPALALRDRLLDRLAHVEALLDFSEEPDVDDLDRAKLARELVQEARELERLAGRWEDRSRPGAPPRVVLHGPPNAGKSYLFNALVGAERAIVAGVPGTTRDYLSALCDCDGLEVELVDTAGESPSASPIESIAQAQRAEQAQRADLVLDCLAPDVDESPPPAVPTLRLATKSDMVGAKDLPGRLAVSAETGAGLDDLRRAIALRLRSRSAESVAAPNARARDALLAASRGLIDAGESLEMRRPDELVAIDLREAIDALGRLVGAIVNDDVLDRVFRQFCIGK